jgi:hypothetical protein
MGSPISSTIAEIFFQPYEIAFIKHIVESKIIMYYTKYVDDILIICDHTVTNPDSLTNSLNRIPKDITFKLTLEESKQFP